MGGLESTDISRTRDLVGFAHGAEGDTPSASVEAYDDHSNSSFGGV